KSSAGHPGRGSMIIFFYRACQGKLRPASVALVFCFYLGCQSHPHVSIDGKNPPTFKLSGPGNIYYFSINEVGSGDQLASLRRDSPESAPIWKIIPDPNTSDRIADLPSIQYGVIPKGFKQDVPPNGPPPALKE